MQSTKARITLMRQLSLGIALAMIQGAFQISPALAQNFTVRETRAAAAGGTWDVTTEVCNTATAAEVAWWTWPREKGGEAGLSAFGRQNETVEVEIVEDGHVVCALSGRISEEHCVDCPPSRHTFELLPLEEHGLLHAEHFPMQIVYAPQAQLLPDNPHFRIQLTVPADAPARCRELVGSNPLNEICVPCAPAPPVHCLYEITAVGACAFTPVPVVGDIVCTGCLKPCPIPMAGEFCTLSRTRAVPRAVVRCDVMLTRVGAACAPCPAGGVRAAATCRNWLPG